MGSCEQTLLVTPAFLREKLYTFNFLRIWLKKHFFEKWSWLKFKNIGLVLVMAWKFCSSVAKDLRASSPTAPLLHPPPLVPHTHHPIQNSASKLIKNWLGNNTTMPISLLRFHAFFKFGSFNSFLCHLTKIKLFGNPDHSNKVNYMDV